MILKSTATEATVKTLKSIQQQKKLGMWGVFDTETGVLIGIPMSASCVQRLDDSLNMQFTLVIALCYVLHRCENQEIRC
jgi:hypothetical protein